ncbi:hypothetical protein SELMODRAFT_272100 [Selaginella moellendorffii]|uniref:Glutathione transferase n=1 Tax=Selaginella moellendorffii TaxID=88036 RepID=D8T2W9_SELML|nr:glutathione S-transferase 2 [Selaginella moellendorffii]XP_024519466.1 glutathione S-transferase 2 [Selaginella moellendorffii]XP_024519467.1 glutathione S-transferase 2 [Selaginella moellendorffii]XP_024519468.1 glutathione S-transferase 2 [Selaginella moellendorffii]EFJ09001.1 hypothetical protein SELMODRAFT_272100 [Selaginella moellendorffii]|eukprot:XP_002989988.1 glutathione S-transferase 2 [Selaginella moellendorffii]
MRLYTFWGSSCAWRVRLALALKGIPYEYQAVGFANGLLDDEFSKINPLGMVPALETEEDGLLIDSVAIVEYLEEKYPEKPLLPKNLKQRATIRQIVNLIASNIQPLQNGGRVMNMIKEKLGDEERLKWAQHWIVIGFNALEEIVKKTSGKYCFGDTLTLADVFVIPQIGNAERYKVDMTPYPTLRRLKEELHKLEEVRQSVPRLQPDFPTE